jgi:hypothetical protein
MAVGKNKKLGKARKGGRKKAYVQLSDTIYRGARLTPCALLLAFLQR